MFSEDINTLTTALTDSLVASKTGSIAAAPILGVGRESQGLEPRLMVYVDKKTSEADVRGFISEVSGASKVKRSEFPLQILRPTNLRLLSCGAHGHFQRPICAGVAIGCKVHKQMGTVGFFVTRKDSTALYFVSCRHIFGPIDQPIVGREVFQPPGIGSSERPIGRVVEDGMLLYPPADYVLIECYEKHRPHMLRMKGAKQKFMRYSRSTHSAPRYDQPVRKSGGSSGFSNGRVLGRISLNIDYPLLLGGVQGIPMSDLTVISTYWSAGRGFFAGAGDSGAPIVTKWAKLPVGTLLAHYSCEDENGNIFNHYLAQSLDNIFDQWKLSVRNF